MAHRSHLLSGAPLLLALASTACGGGGRSAAPPQEAQVLVMAATDSEPRAAILAGTTDGHHTSATDFGAVGNLLGDVVGRQEDRRYRILNAGTTPVQVLGVTLGGPAGEQFFLTQAPESAALQPGGSTFFQLSWRPFPRATLGDNTATVQVRHSGGNVAFTVVGTMFDNSGHH